MAESQTPEKPSGAESPTTARPLDFDDDGQETGVVQNDGPTSPTPKVKNTETSEHQDESAPPKPPRPMSPQAQGEATLREAFPSIDAGVVKAVLVASNGQVEPAFNALLGMSDPNFKEEAPPAQPPRPNAQQRQMQEDELYARQLAEHYNSMPPQFNPRSSSLQDSRVPQQRSSQQQRPGSSDSDKSYSFFDDDLPEIRENLRQGFLSTQTKVNKWISDFKKRMDGEDEDDPVAAQGTAGQRQNFGSSTSEQMYGIQKNAERQRAQQNADRERYDADPKVLSDNFEELELRDEEEDQPPPPKPARPQANPNLFKPTPPAPQSGPVDEVDALYQPPNNTSASLHNNNNSSTPSNKSKKWQPLTSVAPAPEADDNDPFSLGDDDEEEKTKDIRAEDTERLKRSASQSQAAETGDLKPAERSGSMGTRNKEAEELLSEKS